MIVGDATKNRFIAAFVDNLLACGFMFAIVALIPEEFPILKGVFIVAAYLGYFVLLEGLWSKTIGKYFQGLIVRRLDGNPAGLREAIIRSLLRIVEVNPLLFGGIPAGLFVISTARKQRLGDIFAATVVISDKLTWTPEETETVAPVRSRWSDRIVEEPEILDEDQE